ncbi:MAG: hypothetical protein AABY87_12005 [bacterium]
MVIEYFFQIHGISVSVKGDHPEIMEQLAQEWRFFGCGPVPSPRIHITLTQKEDLNEDKTPMETLQRDPGDEIYWIRKDTVSVLNIPNRTVHLYISKLCPVDAAVVILFGTTGFLVHLELSLMGDLAVFHGASLYKDGMGFLLLGKTNSGKTSLSCLLTKYGFSYLSEEDSFIRMESNGSFQILPYPRRIRITRDVMNLHPELGLMAHEKARVQSMDEEVFRIDSREPLPESAPLKQVIFLDNDIKHLSIYSDKMDKAEAFFSLLASLETVRIQESPDTAREDLVRHNRAAFNVSQSIVDSIAITRLKYNIIRDFPFLPGIIMNILKAV